MCGIAAAVGRIDPPVLDAVRRMTESQVHRGPDSGGFWDSGGAPGAPGVALGHRRLAIIDPRPESSQPMTDPESGNCVVLNGEIFNFREIRQELERGGARFRTHSDTEVLLRAYAAWGVHCVGRLRGIFAFVLWDAARREVLIARDPMGVKPVYWAEATTPSGPTLLIASELRALLASDLLPRRVDPRGLTSYLWSGYVVGPTTIAVGVELFPAGCYAVVRPGDRRPEPRRHWTLATRVATSRDTAPLRAALDDAVRTQLVSDVPLGVFLSGGVDSSAVAAVAARHTSTPLRTFTVTFDEREFDESEYARRVAREIGSDHVEIRVSQRTFRDSLRDGLERLDQPTFDFLNTYLVSREVREAGVTVALSGLGGDELFGGYRSFRDVPRACLLSRWLTALPPSWGRGIGHVAGRFAVARSGVRAQTRWGKIGDVLAARGDLLAIQRISNSLFTAEFLAELRPAGDPGSVLGLPNGRADELRAQIRGLDPLQAVSILELLLPMSDRLIRDTDVASMASALEVRVPLVDHVFVEECMRLDPAVRFADLGRKEILRRIALDRLPRALFDRPKQGFVLPLDKWIRGELREDVDKAFADPGTFESIGVRPDAVSALWAAYQAGARGMYWSRVWSLYVLLWWCRRHGMSL